MSFPSTQSVRDAFAYTIHPNWRWIFIEEIEKMHPHSVNVGIPSQLPSQVSESSEQDIKKKVKYAYALFRIETPSGFRAWSTSLAFASLDAKDALYRALRGKYVHIFLKTYSCLLSRVNVS